MCSRLLFISSQTFASAQLVFFFRKVHDHHTGEYVTIWGCAAVYYILLFFENHTYKQTEFWVSHWLVPAPVFHISDRLDQSGYCLLISATIIELFATVYNLSDRHGGGGGGGGGCCCFVPPDFFSPQAIFYIYFFIAMESSFMAAA